MRRLLPIGLPAVLAILAAALVAGCGGATLDPVAQAATKTADAGSFRFAVSVSMGAGGNAAAALTGDGAYDASANRLQARLGIAGQSMEMIVDMAKTPTVYVKPPAGEAGLPPGKTWAKVDVTDAAKAGGVDLGPLSPQQLDPRQAFSMLEQAGDSTRVGTDTIDGVETTHYRVTIDPAKAVEQQPADQQAQLKQALQLLGGSNVPVDVWVDGGGYVRRVSVQLGDAKALFSIGMKLDLSGYGSDVTVDLPPADQVASDFKIPKSS